MAVPAGAVVPLVWIRSPAQVGLARSWVSEEILGHKSGDDRHQTGGKGENYSVEPLIHRIKPGSHGVFEAIDSCGEISFDIVNSCGEFSFDVVNSCGEISLDVVDSRGEAAFDVVDLCGEVLFHVIDSSAQSVDVGSRRLLTALDRGEKLHKRVRSFDP